MSVRAVPVLAACLFVAGGVHATQVELTLAVGNLRPWSYSSGGLPAPAEPPAPAGFDITLRFDLDRPEVVQSYGTSTGPGEGRSFRDAAISPTFYSGVVQDLGLSSGGGPAYLTWAESGVGGMALSAMMGAGTSQTSYQAGVTTLLSTSYSRELRLELPSLFGSTGAVQPYDAGAFVALLQSEVGKAYVQGFSEQYSINTTQRSGPSGTWQNVSSQGQRWSGDVTLKSVSMVPEPRTFVLMALGLAAVAAVGARRA